MSVSTPARRQARMLTHKVIAPDGIDADRWYPICYGRRRDDQRPGMVLLDLGTQRMLLPESCLEFRDPDAPRRAGPARPLDAGQLVAAGARALRRQVAPNGFTLAASLVPIGTIALLAAHFVSGHK
jgi:hypothetical protein